jgi:hypothetical protein
MRFKSLTMVYDFLQVIHIKRCQSTRNDHLPMYILFTIIYLLQEQKLNPRNYSEQVTIMIIFAKANDHYVHMHAKIQYLILHRFLQLISSRFG